MTSLAGGGAGQPGAFELALPRRILFGSGRAAELPGIVAGLGTRAFVCTGADPRRQQRLLGAIGERTELVTYQVAGEPTLDMAREAVARARGWGAEVVVGLGGGSALDMAKAVAMLLAHSGEPLDYVEVIGRGLPITKPSIPYVAVPTTAGSGSEATSNAVLASPEHRVKVSLRSPLMLAAVALVDPDLTLGTSPTATASSGLDALTQCLEPYVSRFATPMTDALARDGLVRAARSLRRACDDGQDRDARADMALASLLGGIALSNAKLGAVHGIAGPFGGRYDAPHGAVCAALLPAAIEVNLTALREREPTGPTLERYREIAVLLTGDEDAVAEDAARWAQATNAHVAMPGLGTYGLQTTDIPDLVPHCERSSSMRGNPVTLTRDEIAEIIGRSM